MCTLILKPCLPFIHTLMQYVSLIFRFNSKTCSHPNTLPTSYKRFPHGRRNSQQQIKLLVSGWRYRELGPIWRVFSLVQKISVTSCQQTLRDLMALTQTSRWAKIYCLNVSFQEKMINPLCSCSAHPTIYITSHKFDCQKLENLETNILKPF